MKITVIGLGFVGLTTALGLSYHRHTVYGIEQNDDRRNRIASGEIPFFEPGLKETLDTCLGKNFFLYKDQSEVIKNTDAVFYCVGTPIGNNGCADLSYLTGAVSDTLSLYAKVDVNKRKVPLTLIVKSTVPPSTMRDVIVPLVKKYGFTCGEEIELADNPEFLREGKCWEDFIHPDRLVLGAYTDRGHKILDNIYSGFTAPRMYVNPTTAEFIKYLSNTLLATMISYSNEMANAAYDIGDIDISKAFQILHMDRRWENNSMSSYVYPGCGYGGYCLPKDTMAMYYAGTDFGTLMPILDSVIKTNENMPKNISDRLAKGMGPDNMIGILGLAFKPFTDDVRDTPAMKVIRELINQGVSKIIVYDPLAMDEFKKAYPMLDIIYASSAEEVIALSERVAVVTAWPEFAAYKSNGKVMDFRYM